MRHNRVTSFNDIAWAESEDYPRGVIAGALENGSIDIWDADKLFSGARCVVIDLCCYWDDVLISVS